MGRSIIEDPSGFYGPSLSWLSAYIKNQTGKTNVYLGFEYINTGSIKWLYIFLRQLAEIREMTESTMITWYYEEGDDDMAELGFILRSLVECQFTILEVDEMNTKLYEDFLAKNP